MNKYYSAGVGNGALDAYLITMGRNIQVNQSNPHDCPDCNQPQCCCHPHSHVDVGQEEQVTPTSTWDEWVWPLAVFDGFVPQIEDGFHATRTADHRQHFGLDIIHQIPKSLSDSLGLEKPQRTRFITRGGQRVTLAIFDNEQAIMPGPGKIFSAEATTTGFTVKTSHRVNVNGTIIPILSVIRHIRIGTQNPALVKGLIVPAGMLLGDVGDNPREGGDPWHIHFELWDTRQGGSRSTAAFDPADLMAPWRMLFLPEGEIRNPPFRPRLPRDPSPRRKPESEKPSSQENGKVSITLVIILIGLAALLKIILSRVFLV